MLQTVIIIRIIPGVYFFFHSQEPLYVVWLHRSYLSIHKEKNLPAAYWHIILRKQDEHILVCLPNLHGKVWADIENSVNLSAVGKVLHNKANPFLFSYQKRDTCSGEECYCF